MILLNNRDKEKEIATLDEREREREETCKRIIEHKRDNSDTTYSLERDRERRINTRTLLNFSTTPSPRNCATTTVPSSFVMVA